MMFRLPATEKLDGSIDCTLLTPLFLSQNYICFESRVRYNTFLLLTRHTVNNNIPYSAPITGKGS